MRILIFNNGNDLMKFWVGDTQHSLAPGQCETPCCTNNHDKISGIGRNQTATTPNIQSWSCALRLPSVSIHGILFTWNKFRKLWICGSGSHRILRIKNLRLVSARKINIVERWLNYWYFSAIFYWRWAYLIYLLEFFYVFNSCPTKGNVDQRDNSLL